MAVGETGTEVMSRGAYCLFDRKTTFSASIMRIYCVNNSIIVAVWNIKNA